MTFVACLGFLCLMFASVLLIYTVVTKDCNLLLIRASCLAILASYLCLTLCFLTDSFVVSYVLQHSSVLLPWYYKFCAVWGGHEGSILLWMSILAAWTMLLSYQMQSLEHAFSSKVLLVLSVVLLGLLWFVIFTSNPFHLQFDNLSSQGLDLNPLLQDPGFLLHPPMLYLGYVGYAIPFAFAMAALWLGRIESAELQCLKPWAMLSWCCLSLGITLGSWWAYRELGWGGFWFWDPVENASIMPWLVGTALLHAVIVSEKQKTFIAWTILLAISAFALSLIGTFLVRSGVLTSVHAFAVDPKRGLYILVFLISMMSWAFVMYASKASRLFDNKPLFWLSKESGILINNILLFVMMLVVLLGTLYPLIVDGLGLGKLSVGAPYFNQTLTPLVLVFLLFMGLGIQIKWHTDSLDVFKKALVQIAMAFMIAGLIEYALGFNALAFLAIALSVWVMISLLVSLWQRFQKMGHFPKNLSYWAMWWAHLGFAMSIMGITVSCTYGIEKDVKMYPGERVTLNHYQVYFDKESSIRGPNYKGSEIHFQITAKDFEKSVYPQKRIYDIGQMVMTDADISYNFWRDIYVALGSPIGDSDWSVRLYYKPLIRWIWLGGLLITLGGVLAFVHYSLIYFRRKNA